MSLSIAELNDQFRRGENPSLGQIVATVGFNALSEPERAQFIQLIKDFDAFTKDNDPYGEHDFGAVEYLKTKVFWKIDYYDKSMTMHSPDKSNPEVTVRVMTIMLASEY